MDGYLQIDAYSIGLTGFTFACSALLTSVGRTWALFPATLILVVTDVALNYLFIFGKFGCPALGIRGAAIGSLGAEFATSVFLAVYLWRLNASRYGFFRFRRPDRRITRLLFRSGGPIALQAFLESLRWFFFFLIFERVSTQALAIANLAYTCYIFFRIPTVGFAETACSMVSRWVGRNRPNRIGGVVRQTIGGAALATVPFIAAALLVPQWVLVAFLPESDLLLESSDSLRVVALAMLIAIPGEMWFVAVMGTGDTLAALGIELMLTLTMLGITYLSAIYLAWPVAVVWLSVPVAWLVCLGVSYGWMKSGIWKRLEY